MFMTEAQKDYFHGIKDGTISKDLTYEEWEVTQGLVFF